jgi:cell wall-associated NlpC family hydrolase/flagellar motility protein MotE (MotC chaperone)
LFTGQAENTMRASLTKNSGGTRRRRALPLTALLVAALTVLAASWAGSALADTPQEELQQTRNQLEGVRESSSELAATIAEQNTAIDSMIGEVSTLRREQAAVEEELVAAESRLDAVTEALAGERQHLEVVRSRLQRALGVLEQRLVAMYEAGSPNVVNTILESEDWSQMEAQAEYLNRIQDYDDSVVGRVKSLRNEVVDAVHKLATHRTEAEEARDEVAQIEAEVTQRREEAEARFAELRSAQHQRRADLETLESREESLSDNLSSISNQIAEEGADITTGEVPAPLNPGQEVEVLTESEASAPAAAPQAVKDAVSAANAIAYTPYIWGGGHGSFESEGYDCSGAVSYALHGGGFLESPLDSTGLETWGEPGPGTWITVYANAEHAWMVIAGVAFDTVGGPGPRWHDPWVDSPEGFVVRHPAGY